MADEDCVLRRRRSSVEGARLTLNLDTGNRITEGESKLGTPTPSTVKFANIGEGASGTSLADLRKKQQSFEIQIEDCDEEVICTDSDTEDSEELNMNRGSTPFPEQDYSANVSYKEGPQAEDFLQIKQPDHECYTDISDAESEDNET